MFKMSNYRFEWSNDKKAFSVNNKGKFFVLYLAEINLIRSSRNS